MLKRIEQRLLRARQAKQFQLKILSEALKGYESNRNSFPTHVTLPQKFAQGLPERAVELMLVRLLYQPGDAVLDIGYANAMECHRNLVLQLPEPRNLTGLDIAEPAYDPQAYYKRSVCSDIVANPFTDNEFNEVWCVSTLEHFGMDNSGYTENFVRDEHLTDRAMVEMIRLLKPGGRLLVTVPYGRYEYHGWHINFDAEHWNHLLKPYRDKHDMREWFFRHTYGAGWQSVSADELRLTGYFDQANAGAAGLAAVVIEK